MVEPYVHPLDHENVEPMMRIFLMQLLQWLHCLIIHDEKETDGFEYRYRFQPADSPESTTLLELGHLITGFKEIFAELSRFGQDESVYQALLGECPSESGGTALFEMWGLSRDQGLRIVGRMAVRTLAEHIGTSAEGLLNSTYLGTPDEDSDNDSVKTVIRIT